MYTENFEQYFKLNKGLGNPMGDLNKVTSVICKRVAEQNLELFSENYQRMAEQIKRLSSVRKPEEFLSLQREIISENVTASIETSHKIIQLAMENMEEITKAFGSTASKITEKAVEKAQKFAEKAEK